MTGEPFDRPSHYVPPELRDLAWALREQELSGKAPTRWSDDPALHDVQSWRYRTDAEQVLRELDPGERLRRVVPAAHRETRKSGVVALTTDRVLFVAGHFKASAIRSEIALAVVDDRPTPAHLQLRVQNAVLTFSIEPKTSAWEFLGLVLAGMDRFRIGVIESAEIEASSSRPLDAVSSLDEPRRVTTIQSSSEAAQEIRTRGGKLYLWQEEFSRDFAVDKLSTSAPAASVDFEALRGDGFDVMIDARIRRPGRIDVELAHLPRKHFKVFWDGARWGQRGGGGGGGGGG